MVKLIVVQNNQRLVVDAGVRYFCKLNKWKTGRRSMFASKLNNIQKLLILQGIGLKKYLKL